MNRCLEIGPGEQRLGEGWVTLDMVPHLRCGWIYFFLHAKKSGRTIFFYTLNEQLFPRALLALK